jgi:hypothetical protein
MSYCRAVVLSYFSTTTYKGFSNKLQVQIRVTMSLYRMAYVVNRRNIQTDSKEFYR